MSGDIKKVLFLVFGFVLCLGFVSALDLTVNEPVNGDYYDSKLVSVDLSTNNDADFYYMRGNRWISLCSMTTSCHETIRVSEGENEVSFKAIARNGNVAYEDVNLIVDIRKPRIVRSFPSKRGFLSPEEFWIKYTEDNVNEVKVTIQKGSDVKTFLGVDCESGRNKECGFEDIDLSSFEGDEVSVKFSVEDLVGNLVESREVDLIVDTTAPKILSKEIEFDRRRVSFSFEIKENNFDKIYYLDHEDSRPRERILCSRLNAGRCAVTKTFRRGDHELDVWAVDKAGNRKDIYSGKTFTVY